MRRGAVHDLWTWPLLRWLAPVAAVAFVAFGPYLAVRQIAHAVRDPEAFVYDLSYYHRAAQRPPAALYADPEFVYPPPSRAVVAPLGALPLPAALGAWMALNALLLGVGAWIAVRLWEHERGATLPAAVRAALVVVALGSGPAFQTLKYGQVNSLVLLAGVGCLALLARGWPGWAVALLCGGFWLKLYPLLLLPLALARRTAPRAMAGLAAGLVGLPLVLLPWIPLDLYGTFFGERLPRWAGLTSQGALNASLTGVLTRLTLPPEAALHALDVPTPPAVRAAVTLVALALVGGLLGLHLAGRLSPTRAGVLLLAAVPIVSPLGWEHVYVLALPLLLAVLVEVREHRRAVPVVAVAAVALLVPRPPSAVLTALVAHAPRVAVDMLNARMPLAVLGLGALLVGWGLSAQRAPSSAPPGPPSAT